MNAGRRASLWFDEHVQCQRHALVVVSADPNFADARLVVTESTAWRTQTPSVVDNHHNLRMGLTRLVGGSMHIDGKCHWSSCSAHQTQVAFHPRPQIASDLGRNITRSFNPHRNRNQFPSGNGVLAYGRRFKSQPASTRCDLRIASPTRPFLQAI